jgi:hypothetical protein
MITIISGSVIKIMSPAAQTFLEKRTTEQRLDDQDQDQSKIVFIKPTHAFTLLMQFCNI